MRKAGPSGPRVYCTAMISLFIAASLLVTPVQDTAHVVLVATTDLHGHITGRDYVEDRPAPNRRGAASRAWWTRCARDIRDR